MSGFVLAALLTSASPMPPPGPAQRERPISLIDALPSPTPRPILPPMPPRVVGVVLFREDFEQGFSNWQTASSHPAGGWHRLRAAACGGLYTMVLGRAYNDVFTNMSLSADLTLVKRIDLTHAKKPQLQYDLKGLCFPDDLATVRAFVRRPHKPWHAVGQAGHARYPLVVTFTADLSPYVGGPIELRFQGDLKPESHPNRGLYLDDINVIDSAQ